MGRTHITRVRSAGYGRQQIGPSFSGLQCYIGIMTEPMPTANSPQRTQGTRRLGAADINRVSGVIIDCSMTVHTHLGPGLLESAYHACLVYELRSRGLRVDSHVSLPISYKGVTIDVGCRLDLVVEDEIIVELKAVAR